MIRSIRYFGVGINSGLLQLQDLWDLAHQNRLIRSLDSTQNHTTKTKIEDQRRGRQWGEERRGGEKETRLNFNR